MIKERAAYKEKVLVIANLWPPNTSTGMYRTKGFVENLFSSGYHPVLVTQNWEGSQTKAVFEKEEYDNYDVYKVNTGTLTQQVNNRLKGGKWSLVRKAYNLVDKVCWSLGIWRFQEYREMLRTTEAIVLKDKEIKKAIIISDPFQLYYIGYRLHKKFGLKWIADYRDAWNTVEFSDTFSSGESKLGSWLGKLAAATEKKWVGTASFVTAVSDHYGRRISAFVKVPYATIYNGFFTNELQLYTSLPKPGENMVILYNGTLYPKQQIEIFLSGFKKFIDKNKGAAIEIRFIGTNVFPEAEEKIRNILAGFEQYYTITGRVSKQELIHEINQADLMLFITLGSTYRGVVSSKIFDYLAAGKPVLCCPSDKEIVEEILTASGQGFFADTSAEVTGLLQRLYTEFTSKGTINFNYNREAVLQYTRENQTRKIAGLLDKM